MSFTRQIRDHFLRLSHAAFGRLRPGEDLSTLLVAEDQTYVRFNNSMVRQATDVRQASLSANFHCAGRKLAFTFDLTGSKHEDTKTLDSLLDRSRQEAKVLPEDPFIVPMENFGVSAQEYTGRMPEPESVVDCVARFTAGTGFTGLYASGPQVRAVSNSAGVEHWFANETYFLDYSLFTRSATGDDKAVKGCVSGDCWNQEKFARRLDDDRSKLRMLERPSRGLETGNYRVYFDPAAVSDLLDMFSWGGVSYKAWKDGACALKKLVEGEIALSEQITLRENFQLALTPRFNSLGELPPIELTVIERGKLKNMLVGSRTAKEFGVPGNCADPGGWFGEHLRSAEVMPGSLQEADVLRKLNTGIYIGNLHYLNWSDVQTARLTGMTRYACFWVENGEMVSPIRDLRFDDSLYSLLGSNLEALTAESHVRRSVDTYHRRALGGNKVPGALVASCRFTL